MKRLFIVSSILVFFMTTGLTSSQETKPVEAHLIQTPSLGDLGEDEWILRYWLFGEAAPEEPTVTLKHENGKIFGSSGCNSYSASIEESVNPGDISIGPIATTRKMCPEEEMEVEYRFLELFKSVIRFHFGVVSEQPEDVREVTLPLAEGHLVLTYKIKDHPYGAFGTMYFEKR